MKIKNDDDHTLEYLDGAAMSFMAMTIHQLNQTLRANGVQDASVRQEICYSFLFEFAYRHDAGWLIEGDVKLFPKVCFAERTLPSDDEGLGVIQALHVPTGASSWHEYACGVVAQYFEEEGETKPPIRTGSYEIEDEDDV